MADALQSLMEMLGIGNIVGAIPYGNEIFALIIILLAVVVAKIFNVVLSRYVHHATKKTESKIDDILLNAVKKPIFVGIVLGGVYLAVGYISLLAAYASEIALGFGLIFTLYGLWFAVRIVNAVIEWYATEISSKTKTEADDQFLPIIKKVMLGIFGFIAFIMILGQFGIEITAMVAALGIGGLAVALALQPTLGNFFSGAYLIIDRPVRLGDFIELESGEKGYVEDISWRSTKIRFLGNNLLIIPNSKLADEKIINYAYPVKEMSVVISVGVGYGEDLERVEKVTVQVAKEVLKKVKGGKKDFDPFVRFKEFGDSNINFSVILRVETFVNKYLLTHEFIKALKKRYDKEGIEIAWPVRKVYMAKNKVD
jgi:small-conductance mechanosensitive channel